MFHLIFIIIISNCKKAKKNKKEKEKPKPIQLNGKIFESLTSSQEMLKW